MTHKRGSEAAENRTGQTRLLAAVGARQWLTCLYYLPLGAGAWAGLPGNMSNSGSSFIILI